MFDEAVLSSIVAGNTQRAMDGRQWAAGVYVLVAASMVTVTMLLSIVVAWASSSALVATLPGAANVGLATVYLAVPLLLFNFLLTAGGGILGLGIVTLAYVSATVAFAVRGQLLILRHRTVLLSGHGPLLNADGTVTAEQLDAEREVLKQYLQNHPSPSVAEMRVARFMARYNAARIQRVPEMIANYRHTEERLIKDLVRKYGPEPEHLPARANNPVTATTAKSAPGAWRRAPLTMYRGQCAAVVLTIIALTATVISEVVAVYVWTIDDYYIIDRATGAPVVEFQPAMTAKALQLMYAWPATATDMRLQTVTQWTTSYCGSRFTANLASRDDRMIIKTDWVDQYAINMTEFLPPDWFAYSSVNEWFTRQINMSYRPITRPADSFVVSSPADARLLIYQNVTSAKRLWVKGGKYSWRTMLGPVTVAGDGNYFEGGTIVIARLAPQDYHRFHAPIGGRVVSITAVDGTLWSVGADAVQSGNDVLLNQRKVVLIDSGTAAGLVAYVAIGATCVGSVIPQVNRGGMYRPLRVDDVLQRGEEIGYMQFGGSTIVLLFRRSAFVPSCDLYTASKYPVEVRIKVGEGIGALNQDPTFNGAIERCEPT